MYLTFIFFFYVPVKMGACDQDNICFGKKPALKKSIAQKTAQRSSFINNNIDVVTQAVLAASNDALLPLGMI
jgi:hypothetical protein